MNFSYNKAYLGGALYSDLRGNIVIRNLVFENNQATEGGAIYC